MFGAKHSDNPQILVSAMYLKRQFLIYFVLILSTNFRAAIAINSYTSYFKNLPFRMSEIALPVFDNRKVCITEFGGIADGETLNTLAFTKAISYLSEKGGGTLLVPEGIWNTGPIVLQSNINLHLQKGALIVFTPDTRNYSIVEAVFEGKNTYRAQSPISGVNLKNVAITGNGIINGSGDAWRPVKKDKVTEYHWRSLLKSGGVLKNSGYWVPSTSSLNGELLKDKGEALTKEACDSIKDFLRPVMVNLVNCENVLLEGVTFENSPSWNIHPIMCRNIIVNNINVRNPSYAQNGDGLDIESCSNVLVVNSTFDVGDDAICLKSGRDEDGRARGIPTQNVVVSDCKVYHGHGGFVIGSEMSGGVRNVSVKNCQFVGTNIGLRFKSARGRGGVVENIYIEKINMIDMLYEPISFSLYYFADNKSDKVPVADETTPLFKDITFKDIVSKDSNKAFYFYGLPEMNLKNIKIENSAFSSKFGAEVYETDQLKLKNVKINNKIGPAIKLENVKNIKLNNVYVSDSLTTQVLLSGSHNENVQIPNSLKSEKILNN